MEREILPFSAEYVIKDLCNAECKRDVPNSKGELIVRCPHTGKWIEVNVSKNGLWKCFRACQACPGNCGGGILDFYNLFFGLSSRSEAYFAIENSLGNTENKRKEEFRRENVTVAKRQEEIASIEIRDKAYTELLSRLSLSKAHRRHLHSRGFTDEYIDKMGFKSIPQTGMKSIAQLLINHGCQLNGVPGFYSDGDTVALSCYGSGFFIPYRDEKGRIQGLQIRRDIDISDSLSEEEKKKLKQQRYRWFTSSGKDGGSSAKNYGYFAPMPANGKKIVYATEGGLKAAASACMTGGWFVAIPGVNCFDAWRNLLTFLKEQGVQTLVDAFDRDRLTNESVARNIEKLHEIAAEYGFEMKEWNWDEKFKGVDDYLYYTHIEKPLRKGSIKSKKQQRG